jgi:uncharacterized protein (DUF2249 family)
MSTTATQAYEKMVAHHRVLGTELTKRADAVSGEVSAGRPHGAAVAGVIAYLAEEVLPHAVAEEKTLYPAAVTHAGLAGLVEEMIADHVTLSAGSTRLATLSEGRAAAEQAARIAGLFAAHAARENDVLLPALLTSRSVNLAELLDQMHGYIDPGAIDHEAIDHRAIDHRAIDHRAIDHRAIDHGAIDHGAIDHEVIEPGESAGRPAARAGQDLKADSQAALLALLLQAAAALTRAGEADRACRIAASAWAELREVRPDLAAKVTAALHGLARKADPADLRTPVHAGSTGCCDHVDADAGSDPVLDVRAMAPAMRHETIFDSYLALSSGAGFILVNDHDPKPLRYQFEAEHTGHFTWDYLEEGPAVWRVRIGRPADAAAVNQSPGAAVAKDGGAEPDLDVRQLPHGQRHGLIFTAFRSLPPGRGFVLVNNHDPLPLRYQFEAQYGGEYTWDYQEAGPAVWRVRIGRAAF